MIDEKNKDTQHQAEVSAQETIKRAAAQPVQANRLPALLRHRAVRRVRQVNQA
jgi:hypothetical protein